MKIASWNVNSLKVRLPQVLDWINLNQPDVLCLQETKQNNDNFRMMFLKREVSFHITTDKIPIMVLP